MYEIGKHRHRYNRARRPADQTLEAGRVGIQVFEDTIQRDGSKQVVQKAYDDSGNLVHFDPKGGSP